MSRDTLQAGMKYRLVVGPIPGVWNKPRTMIFKYVDENETEYIFSARPEAGTQTIEKRHVSAIYRVDPETPIQMPTIWRNEVRIF